MTQQRQSRHAAHLLVTLLAAGALFAPPAVRAAAFVDEYKNNTSSNTTEATNPVIRLLNGYDQLWIPGPTWNTGTPTAEGAPVLAYNIQYVVNLTRHRTDAQAAAAYFDDRRNQSYSVIDGLGPLTVDYYGGSGATTTITSIPADATTVLYNDTGTGAGLTSSALGHVVSLVNTLRGPFSSTAPPKNHFLYPRPFRQSSQVIVVPTLVPAISPTPATDSAFPSGHTNAGYLASLAMAYAIPERYQELLTRASELGNDRILAGMHSPLDVMGGRMEATALAAAILYDPANAALKQAAYDQAQAYLEAATGTTSMEALNDYAHSAGASTDRFARYATNKKNYRYRLTYGFGAINPTDIPKSVPKGAETLLETRQPYLDGDQRREVLRTTALASGKPLLDDPEGWGRLDLFAAADGYGAFDSDVSVTMDASQGGFNAKDLWRNDISGPGKLTKLGTGTLALSGDNAYRGGTEIDAGMVSAGSSTALGAGDVLVNGGTLQVAIPEHKPRDNKSDRKDRKSSHALLTANYAQRPSGTLELDITSVPHDEHGDLLEIDGRATLAGKLHVVFAKGFVPPVDDAFQIISYEHRAGTFAEFDADGLPEGYAAKIRYTDHAIRLEVIPLRGGAR